MKQRIHWVDIAKGIGISLVVLGHCQISRMPLDVITYFHMPLFFFLAGYVFRASSGSVAEFTAKRVRTIVVPYAVFLFVSILASFSRKLIGQDITVSEIFSGFLMMGTVESNRPMWFLRTIFVIEIVYFLLYKYGRNLPAWIWVLFIYTGFAIVFAVDWRFFTRTVNGFFFYSLGHLMSRTDILRPVSARKGLLTILMGACFAVSCVIALYLQYDFSIGARDHLLSYLSVTHFGIAFIIMLSMFLSKNRVLEYLGRNSLIILVTHILVKDVISVALQIFLDNKTFMDTVSNTNAILTTVAILMICSVLAVVVNRWCPAIIGKRKVLR